LSLQPEGVNSHAGHTCKAGHAEKRRKLFPIPLTDSATLKKWECLDSDTGEDSAFIGFRRDKLAEEGCKYHIPDFSNWKNHAAFECAFARLEKNLRTSIS
jgi:hypothetical protein